MSASDHKQPRLPADAKSCPVAKAVIFYDNHTRCLLNGKCESIDIEYRVQQFEDGLAQKDEEITEILQEMAVLVAEEDTTLRDTTNICSNSGKTIEEVSPRQACRKMYHIFKTSFVVR